ncbi:MAG: histidine phosphatase family protein [Pseudomonadota bacterium]
MTRIALLRHFPTAWNAEGRLQGRTDIPLSAASREALAALALPPPWTDGPFIASPLARAQETARALAPPGAQIALDPRLTEFDFGEWEGRVGADLLADPACAYGPVETWGPDFRPPGGESVSELAARVAEALAERARPGAVFVLHRGVMRAILALATGWEWRGPEPFRIKRAALHPVDLDAAGRPVAAHAPVKLVPR